MFGSVVRPLSLPLLFLFLPLPPLLFLSSRGCADTLFTVYSDSPSDLPNPASNVVTALLLDPFAEDAATTSAIQRRHEEAHSGGEFVIRFVPLLFHPSMYIRTRRSENEERSERSESAAGRPRISSSEARRRVVERQREFLPELAEGRARRIRATARLSASSSGASVTLLERQREPRRQRGAS
jgi:hypothetical protein